MSTAALPISGTVLADRLVPRRLAVDAALVVGGAALTAALAQVVIPLNPVPITGQTLAVLLTGATLGARRGAASMLLYAVAGLVLPIYSDHTSGLGELLGASGGYIVGFVPAAAFTGWLAERRLERRLLRGLLAFVAGSGVVFVVGVPWLAVVAHLDAQKAVALGLTPFIIGGVIKAAIAAGVLRGAWALVARADRTR